MLTITDISALKLMAQDGLLASLRQTPALAPAAWSTTSTADVHRTIADLGIAAPSEESPLHVLVKRPKDRVRSDVMESHVWEGPTPAGSFYELGKGALLASPGFRLAQMSIGRTVAQTAAIGMELCGRYGTSDDERGFLDRGPVSTPEDLRGYLAQLKGHYGMTKAARSLQWVLPNSGSPMETLLALLLTLPQVDGGCAFPAPELNMRIDPSGELRPLSSQSWFEADLCWPDLGVIAEYNSRMYHSDEKAQDHDSAKADALRAMGWDVHWVTPGRLTDQASREVLIAQMAHALGAERPEADFTTLRGDLVMGLMGHHPRIRHSRLAPDQPLSRLATSDLVHPSSPILYDIQ